MALNYGLLNPTHSISKGLLKYSKNYGVIMLLELTCFQKNSLKRSFGAFGGWYGVITG
jgi:hypothetical protein